MLLIHVSQKLKIRTSSRSEYKYGMFFHNVLHKTSFNWLCYHSGPKMATSTLNESICEDVSLYPVSPLLVMAQLCIRRSGCNTEYQCNLILGRLY